MNRFLSHLSLRQQLFLSKLLPGIVLILLVSIAVYSEWNSYQEQSRTNRLYQVASQLSDAVFALQTERTYSTAYVSENNLYELDRLKKHRLIVDEKFKALKIMDRNPLLRGLFPEALNRIYFDDELIQQIHLIRTSLTLGYSSSYLDDYTKIIHQIIRLFESKSMLSNDTDLTFYVIGLTKILWLQEYAGIEHAVVSQMLSELKIHHNLYFKFRELVDIQAMLTDDFKGLSGMDKEHNLILKAQDDITFKSVESARSQIFNIGDSLAFHNTGKTSEDHDSDVSKLIQNIKILNDDSASNQRTLWLNFSSGRINLIHDISTSIIHYVINTSKVKKDNAFWSMVVLLFIGVFVLLSSSFISFFITKRFIYGIDAAIASIHDYQEQGEFTEIINANGHDEVAELSQSFNQLIRKQSSTEKELFLSNKAFQATSDGIVVFDKNKHIILTNTAMNSLCGRNEKEMEKLDLLALSSQKNKANTLETIWHTVNELGEWQGEFWINTHTKEPVPTLCSVRQILDSEDEIINYIATLANITELKNSQKEIEYQAQHDFLTGLPNREYLTISLSQEVKRHKRRNKKFAVMFMDLNAFKYVNDTLGHEVGDCVLKTASQRLLDCLREEDIVARQGGDEFLVVLPEVDNIDSITNVANKIIKAMKEPMDINGKIIRIGISIGISQYPVDSENPEHLISSADMAMYVAKENGSLGYSFFTNSINEEVKKRFEIETQLWEALEKKELFLCYQPKINMQTGEVIGAEALVRWLHPEKGLIPPDKFIPIAEAAGMICKISHFVNTEAVKLIHKLQLSGISPVPIAVNISPLQFNSEDVSDRLITLLAQYDISPDWFQIEITETALIKDDVTIINTLKSISDSGIKIAIDDFGTGYSSLSYLNEFPINIVKIDSSFIWKIFEDKASEVLVSTIINMAKGLNKKLVAEGVETKEQAEWLVEHDCNIAQGYLYSKPLTEEEFLTFLKVDNKVVPINRSINE